MTVAIDAHAHNRRFYDSLWSFERLVPPRAWNTWPLLALLARDATQRLEVGPGLHPRLPIEGTHFVDLAGPAVRALRRAGGHARQGDLTTLPFASATMDLLVAFDVIEHVRDDGRALDEISRVLRPGGRLVLSVPLDPCAWSRFDEAVGHFRRYERRALCGALARRGFSVERSAAFGLKPKSAWLTDAGVYFLTRHRELASRWYARASPLLARLQKPLRFVPGFLDAPEVSDALLVCGRTRFDSNATRDLR